MTSAAACGRAILPVMLSAVAAGAAGLAQPAAERVSQIAAWLPEHATGLGPPLADRAAWTALPVASELVTRGEELLKRPFPDLPDDLFLEFSRTGNRTHWQDVAFRRRGYLPALTLAECAEGKGRFLPLLEQVIAALCAERTWVMPAHDGGLANFKGTSIDIDLASSALGWELATCRRLLGDRLSATTGQLLDDNLRKRILEPYHAMLVGERPPNWWILTTNNWNAVCLAGVTGTALAALDSREERALCVAAAELHSRNFLRGFTADGYCSEGLGYWNYGFGNFLLLAETVAQATGGKLDLLADPAARAPAEFAARIEIQNGVSPAFADCGVYAKPGRLALYHVSRRFGLGLTANDTLDPRAALGGLSETLLYGFPNTLPAAAAGHAAGQPLRSWFDQAGILISRPAVGSACQMSVALKAGNNNEHHNHNDVGSFVVVMGDRPVLLDPGAEVYTARTFSAKRYDSNLLNSFGHAVPRVAGKLQRTGAEARGKVLATDFTDDADTYRIDFASCYDVPELTKLERTWVYSRQGAGSLTVTDTVALATAQAFGTALITCGGWRQIAPGKLFVYDLDQAVAVDIDAGGADFRVEPTEIHEETSLRPIRLGIELAQPVTAATITCTIRPAELPAEQGLLRNGGFELGAFGWSIPNDGLAAVSNERAAEGGQALKITDRDKARGTNINSARMRAEAGKRYELRGQVYHVSGSGIGMYVHFLDAAGKSLNPHDEQGNEAPVGSLAGKAGEWATFAYPFEAPAGTVALQLWIHSYNGSEVEAYLDGLAVVEAPPKP
ncbi:MAG: heparinase II/III family protein [Armatimonadetes bacterium]|nr:heparinase II/III family protein [Armatimonadota bacterium]